MDDLIERLLNAEPGARQDAAAEIRRLADEAKPMDMDWLREIIVHSIMSRGKFRGWASDVADDIVLALTPPERAKPTDQPTTPQEPRA